MKIHQKNLMLKGVATALPKAKLDLLYYSNIFGEKEIKRIIMSTGINTVRIAGNITSSDLCLSAAKELLSSLKLKGSDIDGIIFVSQTPDKKMPATSIIMQHKLNMKIDAVAFDVNYGCSGYIYGLYLASMLLNSGGCERVLLCAGDVITNYLDKEDKNVKLVFGDAGSATIIEKGEDEISFILKNDGSGSEYLSLNNENNSYLYMNGVKIMEFALKEVPNLIEEMLIFKNWKKDDVGSFVFHQPNLFMLNYLRKKINIKKENFPIIIDGFGNTSSASIPLVLSESREELFLNNKSKKVVLCGFGAGLSWASAALNLSNTKILPFIEI